MKNMEEWLKKHLGTDIQLVLPQLERKEILEYEYTPSTDNDFFEITKNAPLEILKGLGFRVWDKMNSVIRDNQNKPIVNNISIPIINGPKEMTFDLGIGLGEAPTKELANDQYIILMPGEWYNIIPNGFIVTGLNGEKYAFKRGVSDNDIRDGCLNYGITREVEG